MNAPLITLVHVLSDLYLLCFLLHATAIPVIPDARSQPPANVQFLAHLVIGVHIRMTIFVCLAA